MPFRESLIHQTSGCIVVCELSVVDIQNMDEITSETGISKRNCIPFLHPFTGIIAGPTGCGKTQLLKRILINHKHSIFPSPQRIIWYYAEHQYDVERDLKPVGVEFQQGMPDLNEFNGKERTLLIIDDFMSEAGGEITKLFTKGSHHRNLSIWFIMQNIFHKGKEIRTITLNAHYLIMFKNPRDKQQVKVLARQMFDKDSKVMEEAFTDATSTPHGYLLADVKQATPDHLRLRTNIVPGDVLTVYTSKKTFKKDSIEVEQQT